MVRFYHAVLCLVGCATASAQVYDQEKQNRQARCSNDCFFEYFTNRCTDDPACSCNQHDRREAYFCCVADKCEAEVAHDAVRRTSLGCEAWNLPFPDFEFEPVCGFGVASTTSATSAEPTCISGEPRAGYGKPASEWTDEDQEQVNRDGECVNDCWYDSFPGGSCTDDPACHCNLQKYRERYLCCIANNCVVEALFDAMDTMSSSCEEHQIPIIAPFDPEAICGITLPSACPTATATAKSTSAAASTGTASSASSADATITTSEISASATTSTNESKANVYGMSGLGALIAALGLFL